MVSLDNDILIGTLIKAEQNPISAIEELLPLGFESFELVFHRHCLGVDLIKLAKEIGELAKRCQSQFKISSLGIYGNPLADSQTAQDWQTLLQQAKKFNCDLVCGFTGRIINRPIPESLGAFKKLFVGLTHIARAEGTRIAFENCKMGGDWFKGDFNIAHGPEAWEMIFDQLNNDMAVGLEWEPAHQMLSLANPIEQLQSWAPKIFHVHGKDANIYWDVIQKHGIHSRHAIGTHRTVSFGDTDWHKIISILTENHFKGSIDIEGWHDPIYKDELEMQGQLLGLKYLKECRKAITLKNS